MYSKGVCDMNNANLDCRALNPGPNLSSHAASVRIRFGVSWARADSILILRGKHEVGGVGDQDVDEQRARLAGVSC